MKKVLSLALVLALATSMLTACGSKEAPSADAGNDSTPEPVKEVSIQGTGSSALKPLADVAATLFMEKDEFEGIIPTFAAGGSGTGLKDIAANTVDIGNSDLYAQEKLTAEQCADLVDHKVCTVTMAPIVNKDLGITDLTTAQLKDIFTGKITNWSEVGGPDLAIMLIVRPEGSGTKATFQQYALGGDAEAAVADAAGAYETDNSGELVEKVVANKGAIGYVAMSYFSDDIQAVSIDGVEPTLENTYNGSWIVWSYEHMYTNKNGKNLEEVNKFLDYMMSDEFAPEIEKNGYGAASKLSQAAKDSHPEPAAK